MVLIKHIGRDKQRFLPFDNAVDAEGFLLGLNAETLVRYRVANNFDVFGTPPVFVPVTTSLARLHGSKLEDFNASNTFSVTCGKTYTDCFGKACQRGARSVCCAVRGVHHTGRGTSRNDRQYQETGEGIRRSGEQLRSVFSQNPLT